MVDRFQELREELLRAGVASRNIARAVLEIEEHFQELIDEGLAQGSSEPHARCEADRRLGTNQILVQRYAAQPELRAWSRRWPAIWFIGVALASYVVLSISSLAILHGSVEYMSGYLHRVQLAPQATYRIDLTARLVFLWLLPWCVTATFAVLAYRRRAAIRWPVAGIIAISVVASLLTISVNLTGGATPGEYGAGIGVSAESLPGQLGRAAILALPAVVPLFLAMRRVRRDETVN